MQKHVSVTPGAIKGALYDTSRSTIGKTATILRLAGRSSAPALFRHGPYPKGEVTMSNTPLWATLWNCVSIAMNLLCALQMPEKIEITDVRDPQPASTSKEPVLQAQRPFLIPDLVKAENSMKNPRKIPFLIQKYLHLPWQETRTVVRLHYLIS